MEKERKENKYAIRYIVMNRLKSLDLIEIKRQTKTNAKKTINIFYCQNNFNN